MESHSRWHASQEEARRLEDGEDAEDEPSTSVAGEAPPPPEEAPPPQTQAAGLKPADYYLNLELSAAAHLCGVPMARLQDYTTLVKVRSMPALLSEPNLPRRSTIACRSAR